MRYQFLRYISIRKGKVPFYKELIYEEAMLKVPFYEVLIHEVPMHS